MSLQRAAVLTAARHLLLLLLLTMPVWAPLTRPGLPVTEVGPLPVLHLFSAESGEAVLSGQPDAGWRVDGIGAYAAARLARFIGSDGVFAVKFSAMLAVLLLTAALYGWAKRLAGPRGGVLAAVLCVYTPLYLSTMYRGLDLAALWVVAGMAMAAWAVQSRARWTLIFAFAGALLAVVSLPGMGLWATLAMLLLALVGRQWLGAVAVTIGALAGILLSSPFSNIGAATSALPGLHFHQMVEPGWLWDQISLGLDSAWSYSLGLALLGLLILTVWWFVMRDNRTAEPENERSGDRLGWLLTLSIGLILLLMSLNVIYERVTLLQELAESWQYLLLAVPFLAAAAAFSLRLMPELNLPAMWAVLLIIAVLSAGPALSPDFATYPTPQRPAALYGDNQLILLDFSLDSAADPGTTLTLSTAWMALESLDTDYNIFVHVVDKDGARITQVDTQPLAGDRPMSSWLPGEIIEDSYDVSIPADAPSDLTIRLGIYDWQTLDRLPTGASDALELIP